MQQVIHEKLTNVEQKVKLLAKRLEEVATRNAVLYQENKSLKIDLVDYQNVEKTQVVAANPQLEDENQALKERLAELQDEYDNQAKQYLLLERENTTLKSSLTALKEKADSAVLITEETSENNTNKGVISEERAKQLRKEINQYIVELDKCIEWLEKN